MNTAELVHLVLHDGLGQAELGDAVHQHAAGGVEGLEDGHLIAQLGQIAGTGQAGRAGAYHRHADAVGLGLGGHGVHVLSVPVGHKALQPADGHRLALDGADAAGLALALLGADAAADAGQGVGVGDDVVGRLEVPLGHLGDELGYADVHGAASHAGLVLAVEAAGGLLHGHLLGVAQGDLLEVVVADVGILFRHGNLLQTHIRHCSRLPSFSDPSSHGPAGRGGRRGAPSPRPPGRGRRSCGSSARQNPPRGRRNRGRPRRQTSSCRPR